MVNFSRQSHNSFVKWLWTVDKITLFVSLALLAIGIILNITASPAVARKIHVDDYSFVRKQVIYAIASLGIIFVLSLFKLKTIRRICIVGFIALLPLFLYATFYGLEIKGARRWISLVGFTLQPSEIIKPILIVLTAWLLDCGKKFDYFPGMKISILLYGIVVSILVCQPDIGMTLLVSSVFGIQLLLAGIPLVIVGGLVAMGISSLISFYFLLPHFRTRIDQFLYGDNETSYQINKALAAFQNGNLIGRGPGEGTVKLNIPDAHTDFVFAVCGEEFGLWLCLIIIALFAIIVLRTIKLSQKETNLFVMYSEVGLAASLGIQGFVNMASSLHIIPTKGMTLPFISYGGSSLFASAIEIGMLLAITRKNTASEDKDIF